MEENTVKILGKTYDIDKTKDIYLEGTKDIYLENEYRIFSGEHEELRRELPDSIGNLTNLKKLNLFGINFEKIPNSIGNLKNLELLQLRQINLQELPDSISGLTNLIKFDLRQNNLKTLPNSMVNLTNLTYLDLGSNKLETLPDVICNLTNLTYLDLGSNKLKHLPRNLDKLKKPELQIIVYGNPLKDIPDTINPRVLNNVHYNYDTLEKIPRSYVNYFKKRLLHYELYTTEKNNINSLFERIDNNEIEIPGFRYTENIISDVKTAIAPERRYEYDSEEVRKPDYSAKRVLYDGNTERQRNRVFFDEFPDENKIGIGDLPSDVMNLVYSYLPKKLSSSKKKSRQKKGGKRTKKRHRRTKKNNGKYKRKTIQKKYKNIM